METKNEIQGIIRVEQQIAAFEQQYHQPLAEFKRAWDADQIADKYSFQVERDYWEWEAAVEDAKKYKQLLDELL